MSSPGGEGRAPLAVLVALVVLTPWPYGAADPRAVKALCLLTLATALAAAGTRAYRREGAGVGVASWPFWGLFGLALLQLVPLPDAALRLVAPGPGALWHPAPSAVAAVLGPGPRPVSIDPEATRRALAFATGVLGLALAAAPALRSRRVALASSLAVGAGALAVAVYGVVARALFGNLLYGTIPVPTVAPFGPFVSKNHFAGYVEMAALLAAGLAFGLADEARRSAAALGWVGSQRAGRVVLAAGASAAMVLAVFISLSRGGAASLAAGACVLVALRHVVRRSASHPRRVWAVAALVVAVGVGAVAVLPPEARARLATLAGMAHDNSGQFRLGVWADTLRLWARSPVLGHGYGAYADALPPFKTGLGYVTVEHAESDALETLAEGGLLGLLLSMAAVATLAVLLVTGLRRQTDRLKRGLGLGAAAGAAALLVHSAFDFNLRIPSNALLFSFLGALALAAAAGPEEDAPTPPSFVLPAALALALALALITPSAPTQALPEEARAFAVKGGRPVTPLRIEQATRAVTDVVRRRPANAEAWLFLAWLRSAAGSPSDAAELARHAATLDPQRTALVDAAGRIAEKK